MVHFRFEPIDADSLSQKAHHLESQNMGRAAGLYEQTLSGGPASVTMPVLHDVIDLAKLRRPAARLVQTLRAVATR